MNTSFILYQIYTVAGDVAIREVEEISDDRCVVLERERECAGEVLPLVFTYMIQFIIILMCFL